MTASRCQHLHRKNDLLPSTCTSGPQSSEDHRRLALTFLRADFLRCAPLFVIRERASDDERAKIRHSRLPSRLNRRNVASFLLHRPSELTVWGHGSWAEGMVFGIRLTISFSESPPNFARRALAIVRATVASATVEAAGTLVTSLRS